MEKGSCERRGLLGQEAVWERSCERKKLWGKEAVNDGKGEGRMQRDYGGRKL